MGKACPECRALAGRVAEVEGVLEEVTLRLAALERCGLLRPFSIVGHAEALAARRERQNHKPPAPAPAG